MNEIVSRWNDGNDLERESPLPRCLFELVRLELQLERKRERSREKNGDIRYSTQGHVFFLLNIPKEQGNFT